VNFALRLACIITLVISVAAAHQVNAQAAQIECTSSLVRLTAPISYDANSFLTSLGVAVDEIFSGVGAYVSDEFTIIVELSDTVTAEEFLFEMAANLNGFIGYLEFDTYLLQVPNTLSAEGPQIGNLYFEDRTFPVETSIGVISIANGGDGSLMLTELEPDHYVLTTITDHAGTYTDHPTPGSREWGFEENSDGTVTFYTRGYYRISTYLADLVYRNLSGGDLPEKTNELYQLATAISGVGVHHMQQIAWISLMDGIGSKVEQLGGEVDGVSTTVTSNNLLLFVVKGDEIERDTDDQISLYAANQASPCQTYTFTRGSEELLENNEAIGICALEPNERINIRSGAGTYTEIVTQAPLTYTMGVSDTEVSTFLGADLLVMGSDGYQWYHTYGIVYPVDGRLVLLDETYTGWVRADVVVATNCNSLSD